MIYMHIYIMNIVREQQMAKCNVNVCAELSLWKTMKTKIVPAFSDSICWRDIFYKIMGSKLLNIIKVNVYIIIYNTERIRKKNTRFVLCCLYFRGGGKT